MEDRRPRRFGAMRQHRARMPSSSNSHAQTSTSSRYANTLEFDAVALERSVPRRPQCNNHWDDHQHQFDFSQDSPRQLQRSHALPKYNSGRLKASGQSIKAPGSSFAQASVPGVTDGVLTKVFVPPKTQSPFLTRLTQRNTMRNRGPSPAMRPIPFPAPASSLEEMSAPEPKVDVAKPLLASSEWKETSKKPSKSSKWPVEKEKGFTKERTTARPIVSHYALRDRSKSTLLEEPSTGTPQFALGKKLGKRKLSSEGSAAKPIALDSDSEAEGHCDNPRKRDEAVKSSERANDGNGRASATIEITRHTLARLGACQVMIGRFPCIVDVSVALEWLCLRNIRGKYEQWPLQENYRGSLNDLDDVRIYHTETKVRGEGEEMEAVETVVNDAAFLALKLPLWDGQDQATMESFYDPTSLDTSKAYLTICPLENTPGEAWTRMQAVLQAHTRVQILEKAQAKDHLEALVADPFYYKSRQGFLQPTNDAEKNGRSLSDSDEDQADRNVTVLTYPLPPCTSDIVTIIRRDVARLNPQRYLNDNIIDYYFKRLMLTTFKDNTLVQQNVLFLSSHFYTRLRAGKGASIQERMEAGYQNVSTWLARTDFFHRSMIFLPINKDLHWSLAVILNPGLAGSDALNEDAVPCIAVLDPLGSFHRKMAIVRNLKTFLRMQWQTSVDDKRGAVSDYKVDRVLTLSVNAPQQENHYDCGVYVLKFAEVMLKNCLELNVLAHNEGVVSKHVTDTNLEALITSSTFSAHDVAATRLQIRQCIEADAREYQVRKQEMATADVKV